MLEVCDEAGRVLGYFAPVVAPDSLPAEGAAVPVTAAEVQQLLRQPPGRPLADILADLSFPY